MGAAANELKIKNLDLRIVKAENSIQIKSYAFALRAVKLHRCPADADELRRILSAIITTTKQPVR